MHSTVESLDVFLSYAALDAEWTENWLVPQLEKEGVHVLNKELLAGSTHIGQLAEMAEKAHHTLLVLSPAWVTNQWEMFTGLFSHSADPLGQQRKTIPLLRKKCEPPRSIARLVSADFTSDQQNEWVKQFIRLAAVLRGQQYRTTLGPPLGALLGLEAPTNFIYPKNQHFVGREDELAKLHELLDDTTPLGVNAARRDTRASSRLAGLTGLGGVGKTQLVVEYIYRYREAYPGGIFWVNAADGLEQGLVQIGKELRPHESDTDPRELVKVAFDYLRSDPDTLLVLDNLNDPLLLNQPVMDIGVPNTLTCRVLFTTRRRDLHGLRSIAVDVLAEAEAIELLLRARKEDMADSYPDYALAVKICATLGGLPLAIEMAASYLEQEPEVTLAGYLKRLGEFGAMRTIDNLEQAKEWSPTWHDPVQVTLFSQWEAINSDDAQLLLKAAALMPEAEAIPVARLGLLTNLSTVAREGFPSRLGTSLRRLLDYSLLEQMEAGKKVRLHPLVREYVGVQILNLNNFISLCSTNMANALENMLRVNSEILERGVDALIEDLRFIVGLNTEDDWGLKELMSVLDREAHHLRKPFGQAFPGYILQQIRSRAFNMQSTSIVERVEIALSTLKTFWFRECFQKARESSALLRTFEGHLEGVSAVAITPNGRRAVSGAMDSTLRLWDLETGNCLRIFRGHKDLVHDIILTPDGSRVVSTAGDNTLRLWDLESGTCLRNYKGDEYAGHHLAITPDGKWVAYDLNDKTVRLLDLDSGQCISSFKGHRNYVGGIAITSDGNLLVSASSDRTLRVWDIKSSQCLHSYEETLRDPLDIAITSDSKYILSGCADGTLHLWDLQGDARVRTYDAKAYELYETIMCVAITPDEKYIIASHGPKLSLWDMATGQCLRIYEGHTGTIVDVAITPDGKRAISASWDNTLRMWDLERDPGPRISESHTADVQDIAITPDGVHALSIADDTDVRMWDLENGKCLRTFNGEGNAIFGDSVTVTPDGKRVICGCLHGELCLWDLQSGNQLRIYKGHKDSIWNVAVRTDGKVAISSSNDKTLRLWDLERDKCLRIYRGHKDAVLAVGMTPDGKRAVSASWDKTLRLWDLEGSACLRIFKGHRDWVLDVAITPDGGRAISASADGTLRMWDLESGECLRTYEGHGEGVSGVAITSDSKHIVSASWDGTLRVWDLERAKCLQVFPREAFNCISMEVQKNTIVVGCNSGSLYFLNLLFGNNGN